jgi:hypothetical protein
LANFAQGRLNSALNPGIFDNGPIWRVRITSKYAVVFINARSKKYA